VPVPVCVAGSVNPVYTVFLFRHGEPNPAVVLCMWSDFDALLCFELCSGGWNQIEELDLFWHASHAQPTAASCVLP